ncbi:MAG: hypothetical protein Q7S15_00025, partial [bacterium]|nr:hypothetical protein [bacterium]
GEKITIKNLLYPLLLESSNDAAEAIAEHYGRKPFVNALNDKVRAIGLKSTFFADPSGLLPSNVSTAFDLFTFAEYLFKNKPFLFETTLRKEEEAAGHLWRNASKFLRDPSYRGGKNGYTDEAGYTLISIFDLPLAEFDNRSIAIILLGSKNNEDDVRKVITFLKANVYYQEKPQFSSSSI